MSKYTPPTIVPSPIPSPAASPVVSLAVSHAHLFDRDRVLLRQKRLALTATYQLFDEHGQPIIYIRREAHLLRQIGALLGALLGGIIVAGAIITPAMMFLQDTASLVFAIIGAAAGLVATIVIGVWLSPKRHIGFFADDSMSQELIKVYQDQKVAFINATYTVADADFNLLGWFRKNYLYNIFRKRWYVYGANSELLAIALEDSMWLSIARRCMGEYGSLIRTNFNIYSPDGRTPLGAFNRKFTLFDKYVLDMTPDAARTLDRRLAIALGVMLDTGERR